MATPHVAGATALVLAANPALRGHPEQIGAILRASAATVGVTDPVAQACGGISATQWPNPMIGYGRLDAFAAVQMALALRDTVFADGFESIPP